jgi:hypothetical protein
MARPLWGAAAVATALLAGCGGSPEVPVTQYPVWQIASVASPEAAWQLAARADQPLLIIGNAAYAVAPQCVPTRYWSSAEGQRQLGSMADQRLTGSAADQRQLGSAADARSLGAAADRRQMGAAADSRQLGSGADQRLRGAAEDRRMTGAADAGRLTGAAQDERSFGSDARGRHFGAEAVRRLHGAVESQLRCRLAGPTLVVTGAGTREGYFYSPRVRGALDGLMLN